MNSPVLLIAHRGESHDAPENTLASFALAWERGAQAIELDVHLTRDDELIVCHDPDTARTTGQQRILRDEKLTDLQKLGLPSLGEVLEQMPQGKRALVEIKVGPQAIGPLEKTLKRHPRPAAEIVIISFNIETAGEAKKLLPAHQVHWLVGKERPPDMIAQAKRVGASALNISAEPDVDAKLVKQVHDAGLRLLVWTIDDPVLARRMVEIGVDGITTNRAAWMGEQLR